MMAPVSPLMTPLYGEVNAGKEISTLNPVGREIPEVGEAQDEAIKAKEDLAEALRERYKQPNWYNIAAGFLKPQLGGFAASLGSAAQAAGEQYEAQRAIEPTIYKLRSEIAAQKAGLTQRTAQSKAISDYDKNGVKDVNELRRIYSLDPNSAVGKSIEKRPEFETARRAETEFGLGLQEKLRQKPYLIINDPVYKGLEVPEEKRKEYVNAVENTVPQGVNPDIWKATPFSQKEEAIAKAGNEYLRQGMEEGQKAALDARQSHDVIDRLTVLRTLAVEKDLEPVFSVLSNGDLFAQFRAFLDKNPGKAQEAIDGLVNSTLNKLSNVNPETRAKFDKLVKNIASLEVSLRGTLNNPTDAASVLNQQQSPSLANSRSGFVGILDQLGLNAYQNIEYNNIRHKKGLAMSDLMSTNDMIDFRNQTRELSSELAKHNSLDTTPMWYYPGKKSSTSETPATSGKSETANASSASPMTLESLLKEQARRQGNPQQ
jgi:hypothetical protein